MQEKSCIFEYFIQNVSDLIEHRDGFIILPEHLRARASQKRKQFRTQRRRKHDLVQRVVIEQKDSSHCFKRQLIDRFSAMRTGSTDDPARFRIEK